MDFCEDWISKYYFINQQKFNIMSHFFDEGRPLGRSGTEKEFRSKTPAGSGSQYFFRAVTEQEYMNLCSRGYFDREDSYQGIAPTEDYALKYFGANMNRHLIEFKVNNSINLVSEFRDAGTSQKAEDGIMSLGLGKKASPVKAGSPANGGDYFMYCLKSKTIRWRLVRYIGKKVPSVVWG